MFYYDYIAEALKSHTLWSHKSKFKRAITVHPIKQPENMLSLHHYYKRLEFEEAYKRALELAAKVNKLCEYLPPSLLPPSPATNCQLSIKSNIIEQTSLLYGPGDLLESLLKLRPQGEMPYFYNQKEKYEVSSWTYLSPNTVYEVGGASSAHNILPGLNTELRRVISLVAEQETKTLRLKEFVSGYVRYSPIGREYIVNLKFADHQSSAEHLKRYRLLRPLSAEVLSVEEHYFGPHPSVTVVLPLVGGGDRFGDFLVFFKAAMLEASEKVALRIVVPDNGLEELARKAIAERLGNPSNVFVKRVDGADRPAAIEAAMKDLGGEGGDLAFITDVDTRVQPWFFHTCRSNTVAGKRVYFPIAFWTDEIRTPAVHSSWAGGWGHFSTSQVCIYKSDYDKVGGYGHAPSLLERVGEHGLEAMQAPDTGLTHLLPQRTCADLGKKRQHRCRALKTLWSSERPDLVEYIVDLEEAKGTPLSYS